MVTNEYILGLIMAIGLLLQGFYFGRKQMVRLAIISSLFLLSSVVSIFLHGVYTLDVSIYDVVIAIICVSFFWGVGFVMSGFTIIRERDIGVRVIKKIKGDEMKINLK